MRNSKFKKLLLLMCVCVFGLIVTGCSEAITSDVKITSSKKANLTLGVGMDDELLEAYASMSNLTTDKMIEQFKESGLKYSIKKLNGVSYHMFTATAKNLTFSEVEENLLESGFQDACLTKNYFYATYDPSSANEDVEGYSFGKLASQAAILAEDEDYSGYDISYFVKVTVSFKSKVKSTNGKLSNNSKKVTWTVENAEEAESFYASTQKVTKTAKATSVKNNKIYAIGKTIKVKNYSSVAKMTLDGKTIKNNYKVKTTGEHELIIWSKNGKIKKVTFNII